MCFRGGETIKLQHERIWFVTIQKALFKSNCLMDQPLEGIMDSINLIMDDLTIRLKVWSKSKPSL